MSGARFHSVDSFMLCADVLCVVYRGGINQDPSVVN